MEEPISYNMNYKWFNAKEAWDKIMNEGVVMTNAYDWDWPQFSRQLDTLDVSYPEDGSAFESYKNEEDFLKDFAEDSFRMI